MRRVYSREKACCIQNVALGTEDDIIIVDAEREYGALTRAFGGEVVEISPHSMHHINPLEVVKGYEDENPMRPTIAP